MLACYFFLLEFRQFVVQGPRKYLGNPWNYIDIIPLFLIALSMSIEFMINDPKWERPLNAISCFFMWVKFLYLMRIFRQTSKFISMIEAVITDMRVFLYVFFITLIAFGQAMFILANNNSGDDKFISSFFDGVFFAYRMSLGDFDVTKLGSVYLYLVFIMFVLSTLFLSIIMLNLLIAVISDTYARVEASALNTMYKTMADLMVEQEYLVMKSSLATHDNSGDYLYIAIVD